MVATDLRKRFSTTVLTTTREKTAVINGDMSSIYQLFMYRTVLYGAKEVDKILHMPLGPGCREFESRHSDQNPQVCKSGLGDFALNQVSLKKLQLRHANGLSFWSAEASVFCVTALPWRQSLGISACFFDFYCPAL